MKSECPAWIFLAIFRLLGIEIPLSIEFCKQLFPCDGLGSSVCHIHKLCMWDMTHTCCALAYLRIEICIVLSLYLSSSFHFSDFNRFYAMARSAGCHMQTHSWRFKTHVQHRQQLNTERWMYNIYMNVNMNVYHIYICWFKTHVKHRQQLNTERWMYNIYICESYLYMLV